MKVIYEGFFVINNLDSTLKKDIELKHITTEFKPNKTHEHLYGQYATFRAIGYGNDGINEGLKVEMVSCENEELKQLFDNIEIPHITLSVSSKGKPINTKNLDFNQDSNIIIKCKFGAFIGKPIFQNGS